MRFPKLTAILLLVTIGLFSVSQTAYSENSGQTTANFQTSQIQGTGKVVAAKSFEKSWFEKAVDAITKAFSEFIGRIFAFFNSQKFADSGTEKIKIADNVTTEKTASQPEELAPSSTPSLQTPELASNERQVMPPENEIKKADSPQIKSKEEIVADSKKSESPIPKEPTQTEFATVTPVIAPKADTLNLSQIDTSNPSSEVAVAVPAANPPAETVLEKPLEGDESLNQQIAMNKVMTSEAVEVQFQPNTEVISQIQTGSAITSASDLAALRNVNPVIETSSTALAVQPIVNSNILSAASEASGSTTTPTLPQPSALVVGSNPVSARILLQPTLPSTGADVQVNPIGNFPSLEGTGSLNETPEETEQIPSELAFNIGSDIVKIAEIVSGTVVSGTAVQDDYLLLLTADNRYIVVPSSKVTYYECPAPVEASASKGILGSFASLFSSSAATTTTAAALNTEALKSLATIPSIPAREFDPLVGVDIARIREIVGSDTNNICKEKEELIKFGKDVTLSEPDDSGIRFTSTFGSNLLYFDANNEVKFVNIENNVNTENVDFSLGKTLSPRVLKVEASTTGPVLDVKTTETESAVEFEVRILCPQGDSVVDCSEGYNLSCIAVDGNGVDISAMCQAETGTAIKKYIFNRVKVETPDPLVNASINVVPPGSEKLTSINFTIKADKDDNHLAKEIPYSFVLSDTKSSTSEDDSKTTTSGSVDTSFASSGAGCELIVTNRDNSQNIFIYLIVMTIICFSCFGHKLLLRARTLRRRNYNEQKNRNSNWRW